MNWSKKIILIVGFSFLSACASTTPKPFQPQTNNFSESCRGPSSENSFKPGLEITSVCIEGILLQDTFGVYESVEKGSRARTSTLQRKSEDFIPELVWGMNPDTPFDYLRFYGTAEFYRKTQREYYGPQEVYGEKNFKAWKDSTNFLTDIPLGKLEITKQLIQDTHRMASAYLLPRTVRSLLAWVPGGLIPNKAGVIKHRTSFGKDPLFHPLTEKEFAAVKSNKWISGFFEIPGLSNFGKRRGLIIYSKAKETNTKLDKLIAWFKENKGKMDPIKLAAQFQRAFVSIHPFIDGNGRVSRLLMDQILIDAGLVPPILLDKNMDIYSSEIEWEREVRKGIVRSLRLLANQNILRSSAQGIGPWQLKLAKLEEKPDVLSDEIYEYFRETKESLDSVLIPGIPNKSGKTQTASVQDQLQVFGGKLPIALGGRTFIVGDDGFFYDRYGTPFLFEGGKLYPIGDRVGWIYSMGGKKVKKRQEIWVPKPQTTSKIDMVIKEFDLTSRLPSESRWAVWNSHFDLVGKVLEKKIDPEAIQIEEYNLVKSYDTKGYYHFYPWQREVLERALEVDGEDLVSTLTPFSISVTEFELLACQGNKMEKYPALVLAQYERLDYHYYELQEAAREFFPDLIPKVLESRKKIFTAAKRLLEQTFDEYEKLSVEDRKTVASQGPMLLFLQYLRFSKLSSRSFEEGMTHFGDGNLYLLRADSAVARYTGMIPQSSFRDFFSEIPGHEAVARLIRRLSSFINSSDFWDRVFPLAMKLGTALERSKFVRDHLPQEIKDGLKEPMPWAQALGKAINLLAWDVLGSKFSPRSASEMLERAFVDYYIHSQGGWGKVGTSYSTNTDLYSMKGMASGKVPFYSGSGTGRVYIVKIPKRSVDWNYATVQFAPEYEVIGSEWLSPLKFQASFEPSQLQVPDGFSTASKQFLKEFDFYDPKSLPDFPIGPEQGSPKK